MSASPGDGEDPCADRDPLLHSSHVPSLLSRIHAFDDDDKARYGNGRVDGKRFRRVLHQVREPLRSITSLCTEPMFRDAYKSFVQRHVSLESLRGRDPVKSRVCLEMVRGFFAPF